MEFILICYVFKIYKILLFKLNCSLDKILTYFMQEVLAYLPLLSINLPLNENFGEI